MNTSKTIAHQRETGSDCFKLITRTRSNLYLKDYIDKFNFEDYWCFKASGHQRLISYEDFLDFKYSSYIFFKKSSYNLNNILEWIKWFKNMGGVQYLDKSLPPFSSKKIIIKHKDKK